MDRLAMGSQPLADKGAKPYKEAHDDATRRRTMRLIIRWFKPRLKISGEIVSVTTWMSRGPLSPDIEGDHEGHEFPNDEDKT